jgi:hypothetical protein
MTKRRTKLPKLSIQKTLVGTYGETTYICDEDGSRLASIRQQCPPELIPVLAAAPELLETLTALADFAEQYGPSERASGEDWSGYLDSARAAIARATAKT